MVGIKFLIENEYDVILNKIFHGIDCSAFRWKLEDEEVFEEHGEFFFDKTDYSDSEFQNMIQKKHYSVHLNLQMYYKNTDVNEIKNWDQFLTSACQLIIFIVDNTFGNKYVPSVKIIKDRNKTINITKIILFLIILMVGK